MSRLPGSADVLADPEGFWRFQGLTLIAGVDEVGRGPLAGPVVAAAVILRCRLCFPGLRDSKRLSPEVRVELDQATSGARPWPWPSGKWDPARSSARES